MALLERITALLRANLNELLERAENPETMARQLMLDMRNQLLQAKTQVAMTLADQHQLERKAAEQSEAGTIWKQRAELAIAKGDDALARTALERSVTAENLHAAFLQQIEDQRREAESLRSNYTQLQAKLAETESHCELVIAKYRRTRTTRPASHPQSVEERFTDIERTQEIDRMLAELKAKQTASEA